MAGARGRNLGTGAKAETIKDCYLLTFSTGQAHLPRIHTAHSGLNHPTSISNMENGP